MKIVNKQFFSYINAMEASNNLELNDHNIEQKRTELLDLCNNVDFNKFSKEMVGVIKAIETYKKIKHYRNHRLLHSCLHTLMPRFLNIVANSDTINAWSLLTNTTCNLDFLSLFNDIKPEAEGKALMQREIDAIDNKEKHALEKLRASSWWLNEEEMGIQSEAKIQKQKIQRKYRTVKQDMQDMLLGRERIIISIPELEDDIRYLTIPMNQEIIKFKLIIKNRERKIEIMPDEHINEEGIHRDILKMTINARNKKTTITKTDNVAGGVPYDIFHLLEKNNHNHIDDLLLKLLNMLKIDQGRQKKIEDFVTEVEKCITRRDFSSDKDEEEGAYITDLTDKMKRIYNIQNYQYLHQKYPKNYMITDILPSLNVENLTNKDYQDDCIDTLKVTTEYCVDKNPSLASIQLLSNLFKKCQKSKMHTEQ